MNNVRFIKSKNLIKIFIIHNAKTVKWNVFFCQMHLAIFRNLPGNCILSTMGE